MFEIFRFHHRSALSNIYTNMYICKCIQFYTVGTVCNTISTITHQQWGRKECSCTRIQYRIRRHYLSGSAGERRHSIKDMRAGCEWNFSIDQIGTVSTLILVCIFFSLNEQSNRRHAPLNTQKFSCTEKSVEQRSSFVCRTIIIYKCGRRSGANKERKNDRSWPMYDANFQLTFITKVHQTTQ